MSENMHLTIIELLRRENADFTMMHHSPAGRCAEVGAARGTDLTEACKALLVRCVDRQGVIGHALLCLRSDCKADFALLSEYASVRLAPLDALIELTGCEPGTVPPFSFRADVPIIADPLLLETEAFWFNAAVSDRSLQIRTADFVRIARPIVRTLRQT